MNDKRKLTRKPARGPLKEVSAKAPYPVCGGTRKCSVKGNGLVVCGHPPGVVPEGYQDRSPAARDPQWGIYVPADGPSRLDTDETTNDDPAFESEPAIDRDAVSASRQRDLTSHHADALSDALGVRAAALVRLKAGWLKRGGCWTFPERDVEGLEVGINRRHENGQKRTMRCGGRGLYLELGVDVSQGPVLCPEGASDWAALLAMGLTGIGRPSITGGVSPSRGPPAGFKAYKARPTSVTRVNLLRLP
jgi:hypothetical protein